MNIDELAHTQTNVAVIAFLYGETKNRKEAEARSRKIKERALFEIEHIKGILFIVEKETPVLFEELKPAVVDRLLCLIKKTIDRVKEIYEELSVIPKRIVIPTITDIVILIQSWFTGEIVEPFCFA